MLCGVYVSGIALVTVSAVARLRGRMTSHVSDDDDAWLEKELGFAIEASGGADAESIEEMLASEVDHHSLDEAVVAEVGCDVDPSGADAGLGEPPALERVISSPGDFFFLRCNLCHQAVALPACIHTDIAIHTYDMLWCAML